MSRKGRTGGGGWVHLKGANSMAASGLVFRSDLVGTGRAISILLALMELEPIDLTYQYYKANPATKLPDPQQKHGWSLPYAPY